MRLPWLDLLLTGHAFTGTINPASQLWRNTGSGFSNVTANVAPGLPRVYNSSVAWADYDNDGRLDFLLSGDDGPSGVLQLWRNSQPELAIHPRPLPSACPRSRRERTRL